MRKIKNASIINMSFEGSFSASIKRYIKEDLGRLYVVAAGNGDLQGQGLNVDHSHVQLFPAKLARELPNVISVAAHGENGTLACFSNFGEHTVDLAAPGVAIESTIADGQLAKLTGTSQAAPLVSLAAALLHSQGLSEPALIKQRILSSVDYVPGYRGKLASEGKLNIAKAVSIFDDVIELNDQQRSLFRGRIVSPPATLIIGEKTIPFKVIKKIVNFPLPDGSFVNRVTWFNLGKLEHVYGQLTIPNLILKVGDTCIELPMESIRDVIPAWKTPTQAPVCVTS